MISEKKPFSPTDYNEFMCQKTEQPKVILTEENALAFLESQGYDLSSLSKRNDI